MIPPVWISIRIGEWIWMPLPFVLFWPLLAIAWFAFGVLLTAALLFSGGKIQVAPQIWAESWRLFCALRGSRIDVDQPDVKVRISII